MQHPIVKRPCQAAVSERDPHPRTFAMKTLRVLSTLLVAALPLAAQGPAPDAGAIKAELDSTAAGWNRNDLARYMAAYDSSMTSMTRNGPVGIAATETSVKAAFWKGGKANQQLRYEHVDVQM